jgi:hypothetical protein
MANSVMMNDAGAGGYGPEHHARMTIEIPDVSKKRPRDDAELAGGMTRRTAAFGVDRFAEVGALLGRRPRAPRAVPDPAPLPQLAGADGCDGDDDVVDDDYREPQFVFDNQLLTHKKAVIPNWPISQGDDDTAAPAAATGKSKKRSSSALQASQNDTQGASRSQSGSKSKAKGVFSDCDTVVASHFYDLRDDLAAMFEGKPQPKLLATVISEVNAAHESHICRVCPKGPKGPKTISAGCMHALRRHVLRAHLKLCIAVLIEAGVNKERADEYAAYLIEQDKGNQTSQTLTNTLQIKEPVITSCDLSTDEFAELHYFTHEGRGVPYAQIKRSLFAYNGRIGRITADTSEERISQIVIEISSKLRTKLLESLSGHNVSLAVDLGTIYHHYCSIVLFTKRRAIFWDMVRMKLNNTQCWSDQLEVMIVELSRLLYRRSCHIVSVVADNASPMHAAIRKATRNAGLEHLLGNRCAAHIVQLTALHVMNLEPFAWAVRLENQVFKSELSKMHLKEPIVLPPGISRPNSTRWNTHFDCLRSLLRCSGPMIAGKWIASSDIVPLEHVCDLLQPFADATNLLQSDKANVFTTLSAVAILIGHIKESAVRAGIKLTETALNDDGTVVNWEGFRELWEAAAPRDELDQAIMAALENPDEVDETMETLLERRQRLRAAAEPNVAADAAADPDFDDRFGPTDKKKGDIFDFGLYQDIRQPGFEQKWKKLYGGDATLKANFDEAAPLFHTHFARADFDDKTEAVLQQEDEGRKKRVEPTETDWIKIAWSYFHRQFYDKFCTDPVMLALCLQPTCDYSRLNGDIIAGLRRRLLESGAPLLCLCKGGALGTEDDIGTAKGLLAHDWSRWIRFSTQRSAACKAAERPITLKAYWNAPTHRFANPMLAALFDMLYEMPATEAACERAFSKMKLLVPKFRSCMKEGSVRANVLLFNNFEFVGQTLVLDDGFEEFENKTMTGLLPLGTEAVQHLLGYLVAVEHKNAGGVPAKNSLLFIATSATASRLEKPFAAQVVSYKSEKRKGPAGIVAVQTVQLRMVSIDDAGRIVPGEVVWHDWSDLLWTRLCTTLSQVNAIQQPGMAAGKGHQAKTRKPKAL